MFLETRHGYSASWQMQRRQIRGTARVCIQPCNAPRFRGFGPTRRRIPCLGGNSVLKLLGRSGTNCRSNATPFSEQVPIHGLVGGRYRVGGVRCSRVASLPAPAFSEEPSLSIRCRLTSHNTTRHGRHRRSGGAPSTGGCCDATEHAGAEYHMQGQARPRTGPPAAAPPPNSPTDDGPLQGCPAAVGGSGPDRAEAVLCRTVLGSWASPRPRGCMSDRPASDDPAGEASCPQPAGRPPRQLAGLDMTPNAVMLHNPGPLEHADRDLVTGSSSSEQQPGTTSSKLPGAFFFGC